MRRFQKSQNEQGAFSLEFLMVGGLLLVLCAVLIEFLRMAFLGLSLQFITNAALRQGVVDAPPSLPSGTTRAASIEQRAIEFARMLGVGMTEEDISICPIMDRNCAIDNAGSSGEFIAVRIELQRRVLFVADIVLTGESVGRNEPF